MGWAASMLLLLLAMLNTNCKLQLSLSLLHCLTGAVNDLKVKLLDDPQSYVTIMSNNESLIHWIIVHLSYLSYLITHLQTISCSPSHVDTHKYPDVLLLLGYEEHRNIFFPFLRTKVLLTNAALRQRPGRTHCKEKNTRQQHLPQICQKPFLC